MRTNQILIFCLTLFAAFNSTAGQEQNEGKEFYFMGDVTPIENSFEQTFMPDDYGKEVSVVKIKFNMNQPVSNSMYDYIIATNNKSM